MSCEPSAPTFRLLDPRVGWDIASIQALSSSDRGILLEPLRPGQVDRDSLAPWLPPPWLAPGCGACDFYLAWGSRLLRRDPCTLEFRPLREGFGDLVAVAVSGRRVAVADAARGSVVMLGSEGRRLIAAFAVDEPVAIALLGADLFIASHGGRVLEYRRFGGELRARTSVPQGHRVIALRAAHPGSEDESDGAGAPPGDPERCPPPVLWALTQKSDGTVYVLRTGPASGELSPSDVEALFDALQESSIARVSSAGFCLRGQTVEGEPETRCYDREGRPLAGASVALLLVARYERRGQLLTAAIDSGIARCRWHRVLLDASVPFGTQIEVAVSTTEEPEPAAQGGLGGDSAWSSFESGLPHPDDWQSAPPGSTDFLVDQPAGRYLLVRLRMTGDGFATPELRGITLEFPRNTSINQLPAVFREDPRAEDFTERFLSLFDVEVQALDRAIERYAALLDPAHVHEDVLPWLAAFFDIVLDPSWSTAQRRRLLAAVPELYPLRGTLDGLRRTLFVLYGIEPVIEELALERGFGGLSRDAELGRVRLFSLARSRFRVGLSPLGGPVLRSHGDPDHDPLRVGAFRFRVLLPPGPELSAQAVERVRQLVGAQKPAHTLFTLRAGAAAGYRVGRESAVGIDTLLSPLPPAQLGKELRLGHNGVLQPGAAGHPGAFRPGASTAVGVSTVLQ